MDSDILLSVDRRSTFLRWHAGQRRSKPALPSLRRRSNNLSARDPRVLGNRAANLIAYIAR